MFFLSLKPSDAKAAPGTKGARDGKSGSASSKKSTGKSPQGDKSPTGSKSPKPNLSPLPGTTVHAKSPQPDGKKGKAPKATDITVKPGDPKQPSPKPGDPKRPSPKPGDPKQPSPKPSDPKPAASLKSKQHPDTNGNASKTQYQTGSKGFPCPCCKKFVTTPQLPKTSPEKWPELFPESNILADLVDLHTLKSGTRECDPCKKSKKSSKVHSYCKNCRDALCEPCATTHKGLRSCKDHKVLATSQFAEAISTLKVEEEFCPLHEGKVIERYCHTHSALCCSQCMAEIHRNCEKTNPLEEAAKKVKESGDEKTLDSALAKYKEHLSVVLKDRTGLIKRLDTKKGKLMDEFIGVKKHIVAQLEKMEKDLKTVLDATHKQETKRIKYEVDKCKELQSAVVNTKESLALAVHHGSNSHIVSTTENVRKECEYYEESLGILGSKLRNVDYDIHLDHSLQQVMKRLDQFGRVDVNTTPAKLPPHPKIVAAALGAQSSSTKGKAVKPTFTLAGKSANEIGEFCARFEEDTQDCWFTGALFLSDGRILLADRTNRKLKLFTSNFNPITELALSSKPWDVTSISDKEIAVSLPAECRIQFVSVDGNYMGLTRSISTDEPCFGVCHTQGKILTVTYDGDPPNMKILSTTGKELTYVCVDDDGFALFSKPVYVTCTNNASQIYVSDERLGCVVSLKETGELNFAYSAMDLGNAAGLALDNEGNIYVCGATTNSVHVVSPNGDRVKVLVTGEHVSYPRAVAFEPKEKKLLVTQGNQEIVKVYSVA